MSSKYETNEGYEEYTGSLIVTQYGQSRCPPHRICSRSPRAPLASEGSAPADAQLYVATLLFEPDSPRATSPLVQLGLEVVDIALGSGQLILSVLQPSAGIIKEVRLDVAAAVGHHQLIIQLLDPHLQTVGLLKELYVALLDVLDEAVLGLHLVSVLLQVQVLVSASRGGLLKQGAHMLGVACRERSIRVVGRKLGVTNDSHALTPHRVALVSNGEQGDDGTVEARQVALTELHESLVGSPIQGVIKVVALTVVNQVVMLGSEG
jgi:hypothetical protein